MNQLVREERAECRAAEDLLAPAIDGMQRIVEILGG
jgi:hypothetical protein